MALETLLAPQTAAGTSTAIVCDGISAITVGIYASASITERVGAYVVIESPSLPEMLEPVRTLTRSRPSYRITQAGTYYIIKPATTQAIGAFGYPSEGGVAPVFGSAVRFAGNTQGAVCDTILGGTGAINFEVQALVYIDGAYTIEDRVFMLQYNAGRQAGLFVSNLYPAVLLATGDSQVGSSGGSIDAGQSAIGKWCLLTFSGDGTVAPTGLWNGSIESLDGSIGYTSGGRTKGVESSLECFRVDLNGGGVENGWLNGIRFAEVRGYNAQRTAMQRQADLTNTDPTGAAFWWRFSDDGGGGVAVTDLTGNGIVPFIAGGTLEAGPTI